MSFDPDRDVPELTHKVILITGGTTGLGQSALLQLAKHNPKAIYFTGRNAKSAAKVIEDSRNANPKVHTEFLECDFTVLGSVQACAKRFLSSTDRLDILMCNAGIMAVPAAMTKDGYEVQFGTNHMAHALLIRLLMPKLLDTANQGGEARLVINTSLAHVYGKSVIKEGIAFDSLKTNGSGIGFGADWRCYAQSKLANVLYTMALAKRYPNINITTIHPGVVNTPLVSDLPFLKRMIVYVTNPGGLMTSEEGAHTQVWAATMPEVKSGNYYEPVGKLGSRTDFSKDEQLQEKLWDWTETELRPFLTQA